MFTIMFIIIMIITINKWCEQYLPCIKKPCTKYFTYRDDLI